MKGRAAFDKNRKLVIIIFRTGRIALEDAVQW